MKENTELKKMGNYWSKHSNQYLDADKLGWGAVLYTGMPIWFNKFFDYFQRRAFNDLTKNVNFQGKNVLDVGCGIGRWCLLLKQKGCDVTGIDIEKKGLEKAKKDIRLKGVNLKQMSVEKLDFDDETFDLVNSVTVLQHIPYKEKRGAIKEICRVVKRGGYISIIESIDMFDDAPHMFPLPCKDWIKKFRKNGCVMVKSAGCEYSPVLRLLRYIQFLITKKKIIKREKGEVKIGAAQWLILRLAILLSYPLEEVCINFLPVKTARHAGFLFKKT